MRYLGRITDPKDLITKEFAEGYIATTEYNASSASRAYSVGEYLILNKTLYQVTSAIAINGAITVNTNVVAVPNITDLVRRRIAHLSVTLTPSAFTANADTSIPANFVGTVVVSSLPVNVNYLAQLTPAPNSMDVVRVSKFKPFNDMENRTLYVYCDVLPTASVTFVGSFEQL